MNSKVEKFKRQLERAGALVMIPDDMPDDLTELFLEEIMSCPECATAISAASRQPNRVREH